MPKPLSDTQCVSHEHYCIMQKSEGEAEKKLSIIHNSLSLKQMKTLQTLQAILGRELRL